MIPPDKPSRKDTLLERTTALLRRSGLRARKNLGQHFLIDEEVLELILSTAELTGRDIVVEIGPGLGVLTEELCHRAGRVIAVELDDRLAGNLDRRLSGYQNLTIINRDILKIPPPEIFTEAGIILSSGYKVVANLPYYITSPVLRHFLESELKPELMVVMVQKEVAGEIAAQPGKMSLLSLGIQLYGQPEIVTQVPAECFYPEPAVDSALLKIVPHQVSPVDVTDTQKFFSFVKAGFSAARKQLSNSLSNGLEMPKEKVQELLDDAGISPSRRAETLSLEEWAQLWHMYDEVKQK
ncbi:MAG: ribosomal RNA small subunit methyltransferase A [Dehalococcoidales bacterium]|nr:MAG: ribosomal RNA small subunit methyltransferase A [Dehalococcoidales bacterium]